MPRGGRRPGAGRPAISGEAMACVSVAFGTDELAAYKAAAEARGVSLAAWVRAACHRAISRSRRPTTSAH